MKPKIIFLNVQENKINKMRPVLGLMGIAVEIIDSGRLGDNVGYIACPQEYENTAAGTVSEDFGEEFMLLCGFDQKSLDAVLNFMRKNKMNVSLKAMLTETNSGWTLARLLKEISAERQMLTRKKQSVRK